MQVHRGRLIPGLILILLGMALLLKEYFEVGPGLILIVVALFFLTPYAIMRAYGLLVPGSILAGLGIGLLLEHGTRTEVTAPIGLGLGFVAIFAIDFAATRRLRWWPLVPGVILVFAGIADAFPEAEIWLQRGWPILLIAGGLLLLTSALMSPRPRPRMKDGA